MAGVDLDLTPSYPIFVDEHLTKETLDLRFAAKNLRNSGVIFSASCRNGKIRIKRTENSQLIRVRNQEQLHRMMAEMEAATSIAQGTKRTADTRSPDNTTVNKQTPSQKSKAQKQQPQLQDTLDRFKSTGNVRQKENRTQRHCPKPVCSLHGAE